jgi:hypothetical protein
MGMLYVKENFLHKCLKLVKLDNISNNQIIRLETVHMFRNRLPTPRYDLSIPVLKKVKAPGGQLGSA